MWESVNKYEGQVQIWTTDLNETAEQIIEPWDISILIFL